MDVYGKCRLRMAVKHEMEDSLNKRVVWVVEFKEENGWVSTNDVSTSRDEGREAVKYWDDAEVRLRAYIPRESN